MRVARGETRRAEGNTKRGPFADLTNTVAHAAASAASFVKPSRKVDKGLGSLAPLSGLLELDAPAAHPPSAAEPDPTLHEQNLDWKQNLDEVDRRNAGDPQHCAEYVKQIMLHMTERQGDTKPAEGYMEAQREVTEKMRAILVDWLVEVHQKFKLGTDTLFLTVSLLDRFLAARPVSKAQLQLVGVTCLLLAAKYEEIYAPEVRDIVNIVDKAYTRSQVLEMEVKICNALKFRIVTSTSYAFLQRYCGVMQYGRTHTHLAQYILELTFVDSRMLQHDASQLASAAVYLANKIMRVDDPWPARLKSHTRNSDVGLRPCAKEMCSLLQGAAKSSLQAVRKKFSSEKLDSVAKLLA